MVYQQQAWQLIQLSRLRTHGISNRQCLLRTLVSVAIADSMCEWTCVKDKKKKKKKGDDTTEAMRGSVSNQFGKYGAAGMFLAARLSRSD